eukprot:c8179_g1_i2.p1 GENE.c8179_g1_i2~~c8179_g1_i2.p1  ORF type:complete len:1072 (-),score=298.25 c8179_g1_i2:262-3477(-)
MKRFDKTFFATSLEFHSPSEHTVNGEHLDMEIQVSHSSSSGQLLHLAVLLQASEQYVDNSFLAPIWTVAQNITSAFRSNESSEFPATSIEHQFISGDLNFVDNLLPSLGLDFNYVTYDGSVTSPNCEETRWVVLQYPARLSMNQLSLFLSTMKNVDNSQARADGSNNRPVQEGEREFEHFEDGDCYYRYCHNVFALGDTIDFVVFGVCFCILIFFTVIFEFISQFLNRKVGDKRTASDMIQKVQKELSVLGLVSFVSFAISSSCTSVVPEKWFLLFDFQHVLIFMVAILYVIFSGVLLVLTSMYSASWDKILLLEGSSLLEFIEVRHGIRYPSSWAIFGRFGPITDLGIFHFQHIFIERNQLPTDFDFLKYIKYYLSQNIKQQLDISALEWIIVTVVLGFWGAFLSNVGPSAAFGPLGWINVVCTFCMWVLSFQSFKKLLRLLGVESILSMKAHVSKHHSKAKSIETKALFQARKSMRSVTSRNAKEKKKTSFATSVADVLTGKTMTTHMTITKSAIQQRQTSTIQDLKRQRENTQYLQKCWIPFGTPKLIQITLNITLIVMCYYTGYYIVNASSYLSLFQHILVISSVLIVVGILMPLSLLTFTLVEAIAIPDYNLIGEVIEYMEQLHQIRSTLVDTLFPNMQLHLLDDVTEQEVRDVLLSFDKDGNLSIDLNEMVLAFQMLGIPMSESKARNFVRMLDADRNGIIDGDELFEIVFQERVARIDAKIVATYRLVCPELGEEQVTNKHIREVLNNVFQPPPPDVFVREVARDFDSEHQVGVVMVHLLDLRNTVVRALSKRRTPIKEIVERLKAETMSRHKRGSIFSSRRKSSVESSRNHSPTDVLKQDEPDTTYERPGLASIKEHHHTIELPAVDSNTALQHNNQPVKLSIKPSLPALPLPRMEQQSQEHSTSTAPTHGAIVHDGGERRQTLSGQNGASLVLASQDDDDDTQQHQQQQYQSNQSNAIASHDDNDDDFDVSLPINMSRNSRTIARESMDSDATVDPHLSSGFATEDLAKIIEIMTHPHDQHNDSHHQRSSSATTTATNHHNSKHTPSHFHVPDAPDSDDPDV